MTAIMSRNRRINHRAKNPHEIVAKSAAAEQIYGFHPVVAALTNPMRRNRRLLLTVEARNSLDNNADSPDLSELESGVKVCRVVARQEIEFSR